MDNINHIKQSPMMGQIGLGGGAASLGRWTSASATYVDDVFSTYVYTGSRNTNGSGSADTINNGIDLSGEGGMIWLKGRDSQPYDYGNGIFDTVRGKTKNIQTQTDAVEATYPNAVSSFNSNGFTLNDGTYNWLDSTYASWTFRKKAGFFTCLTYSGNGTQGRTVDHDLGCVPGCILIKCTSHDEGWQVYHRGVSDTPQNSALKINTTDGIFSSNSYWNNTAPTSTQFTLYNAGSSNDSGKSYVAYLFAGGEDQTTATARSVDFDGTTDELSVSDSADFDYGSGDFTLELWINPNVYDHSQKLIHAHTSGSNYGPCNLFFDNSGTNMLTLYASSNNSSFDVASGTEFGIIPAKSWTHIAVAREGNNIRMFRNGIKVATISHSGSMMNPTGTFDIGARNGGSFFNGKVSNFRVVKGTAVYTTSFRPPTEPLTNITNTVLLCCNNASTTGSTVVPSGSSITANGDPTASTVSPFDDPDGFAFGPDGDQQIIKCGSYEGTGQNAGWQANNPLELGWVPQWVMVKRVDNGTSGDWVIADEMRSIYPFRGRLHANETAVETTSASVCPSGDLRNYDSESGFNVRGYDADVNTDGGRYLYVAIREAAGLTKRPPSAGTEVFTVDAAGNSSSTIPAFDSAFAVNFLLNTIPASSGQENLMYLRKGSTDYIKLDSNASNGSNSNSVWDSNVGWGKNFNSSFCSWMWASYSGAVGRTHYGTGVAHDIAHNLGQTPEMMWVRAQGPTGATVNSAVYHKALPSNVDLQLNQYYTYPATDTTAFNSTAPTSTHYTVGTSTRTNNDGTTYFVMLYASVDGISKVGSFSGSNSEQTITCGFQPRFLLVKQYAVTSGSVSGDWVIVDTVRGWGAGNDQIRYLNSTSAVSAADVGAPTSTGFTLTGDNNDWNQSGKSYIYYAHA